MDIATLQRLSARTWPGLEQDRLGEWELRAGAGFTARANSALPIGRPGVELDEAMHRVSGWYSARGLTPRLQVPSELPGTDPAVGFEPVDAWCDARGWLAEPWTLVMVRNELPAAAAPVEGVQLHWADTPEAAWLNLYHYRAAELPSAAVQVITAAPARYLTAHADGAAIGIGRAAVVENLVVLTAIEVAAGYRRQGHGTAITEALAADGALRGATLSALQVFAHNAPAVRLYRSRGYRDHHRYRYRTPNNAGDG